MATVRNLIVRISVTENTDKGIRKVTTSLRETNRELDNADKKGSKANGTFAKLGRTSLRGLTSGLGQLAVNTRRAVIGLTAFGAAAAGLHTVAALGSAIAPLSGLLLALPGAALGAATALGVLHLGLSGVTDAFKEALGNRSTDPKKFAASLKILPPAARAAAVEVHKLRPALLSLRATAQQNLFKPLVGQIGAVAKVLIGPLKQGIANVALQFGEMGRAAANFFKQSATAKFITTLFNDVAASLHQVSGAVFPVLTGLRGIGQVGVSFLPQIATSLRIVATRFGAWLQEISSNGQAARWFSNALATLRQIGTVLSNVGGILKSVFSAASAAGSGAFGVLGQALGKLNAFLKTAQGQQALTGIFQALGAAGQVLGPIIAAVVTQLGRLAGPIARLVPLIGPILLTAINALGPALLTLTPGLRALLNGLGGAFKAVAPALAPLGRAISAIAQAIGPILPVVGQLAALLAQNLANSVRVLVAVLGPVIQAIAASLAPILPQLAVSFAQLARAVLPVATMFGQQLAGALRQILPQILAIIPQLIQGLVPALIQLLIAVTPLLPQLVQLGTVLAQNLVTVLPQILPSLITLIQLAAELAAAIVPVTSWVLRLATALSRNLGAGLNGVLGLTLRMVNGVLRLFLRLYNDLIGHSIIPDLVNGILRWFGSLPGRVAAIFGNLVRGAVSLMGSMLRQTGQLARSIAGVFGNAGKWLYGAGKSIIYGLINGLWAAAGRLWKAMSQIAGYVRGFWPFSPAKHGPLSGSGSMEIAGRNVTHMLARGMLAGQSALGSAASRLATIAQAAVPAVPAGASPAGGGLAVAPRGTAAAAGTAATASGRVVIDVTGADGEFKRLVRKMVRTDGGGDVQRAFGDG